MGLFNKIKNIFSKEKTAEKYEEALTKTRKEFSVSAENTWLHYRKSKLLVSFTKI